MANRDRKPVVIIGGGPAGTSAALCLRKLGHEVKLFEKQKFPRYRIGESLLPGTLSILTRLGVADRVQKAGFTRKNAATFIWGGGRPPWSFTFGTPKTAPWVFDHALQVTRAEYDHILLKAAADHGADVREECEVTDVQLSENSVPSTVAWKSDSDEGTLETDFVIDASGLRGSLSQKLTSRQWDKYYRNMAIWSYWKGGKRYKGDLEGNIFSVTFKEGWFWIIPLKDDVYSVGAVTSMENNERIREMGAQAFYMDCVKQCPLAVEILETATQSDEVRILREWSYEAKELSHHPAFFCGDAACFIDPLFSSGVHLATYSGMLAAAAIDHLYEHPEDRDEIHAWYEKSYREAYQRYHKFVAAFYACNDEPQSTFWSSRKIEGAKDARFEGKSWFTTLTGETIDAGASGVEEVEQGASTLATLWQHGTKEISDKYDGSELSTRRMLFANDLLKQFNSMQSIRWLGKEVRLEPSYRVHPTTFKLERQQFIGDESGRTMRAYALTEEHRALFEELKNNPMNFKELTHRLKGLVGGHGTPLQIVGRLNEEHFIQGYDKEDKPVKIRSALRFGGVGSEDDIS
ncbi:MAG: NAD(P)/FAD-dependent oxidoreductase [Gemmatimonadaceae bacterium]